MIKAHLFPIIGIAILTAVFGCQNSESESNSNYIQISGEAQGTTYAITYLDSSKQKYSKAKADSTLEAIDNSLSAWVENSTISIFNQSDSIEILDPHFLNIYFRGKEIGGITNDAFELKILPLVNAWGFGPNGAEPSADVAIDSLLVLVNKDFQVKPDTSASAKAAKFLFLKKQGQAIDVNGIAQGYSVDVIAEQLKGLDINNFMVEIGGEVVAYGRNQNGEVWRIGIDKPRSASQTRELEAIVELKDKAMATSGSYRKFYEKDGKKFSHTISPLTGKPVDHNLLSVTVQASNCTNADAFATAFMVMGVDETKRFIEDNPQLDLELFLIYGSENDYQTFASSGFEKSLKSD